MGDLKPHGLFNSGAMRVSLMAFLFSWSQGTMKLELSLKHRIIQKVASKFAMREPLPIAAETDRTARFPLEVLEKMKPLNYFGLQLPQKYGGAGIDTVGYAIVVEEISKACAAVGLMISVHNSVVSIPILEFGTDEQKDRFLVPLARGEMIGAFCLTEPNAGSDPSSMESYAALDGDRFLINGNKAFVTNGGIAGIAIVFCRTRLTDRKREISAFLCNGDAPGISRSPVEDLCGMRGNPVCSWIMEDCPIPRENMLGGPGDGIKIALYALDTGRIGIAAQALGIGQACLEASITYAKQREQFGKPIGQFQFIQGFIAEMAVEVEAARLLIYRAAFLRDENRRSSLPSAMAKLFASEMAMKAALRAVQIHGGYGYTRSYPVERLFRDAKITEIYEGTSEIQRMVIARDLLKGERRFI